jgi:hypothetical protein
MLHAWRSPRSHPRPAHRKMCSPPALVQLQAFSMSNGHSWSNIRGYCKQRHSRRSWQKIMAEDHHPRVAARRWVYLCVWGRVKASFDRIPGSKASFACVGGRVGCCVGVVQYSCNCDCTCEDTGVLHRECGLQITGGFAHSTLHSALTLALCPLLTSLFMSHSQPNLVRLRSPFYE